MSLQRWLLFGVWMALLWLQSCLQFKKCVVVVVVVAAVAAAAAAVPQTVWTHYRGSNGKGKAYQHIHTS